MTIMGLDDKPRRRGLGATIPKRTPAEINADRERSVANYKAGKAERDATMVKMAADAAAAKARANAADAQIQAKADAAAANAQTKWLAEVAAREQAQKIENAKTNAAWTAEQQAKKQALVVVAPDPGVVPTVNTTTVVVPAGLPAFTPDMWIVNWNKGWTDFFTSIKSTLGIK